jgi:hypothetical protein
MSRKHEAETRKARREFEQVLSQLLEEEWQRWAPANGIEEWSEEAERDMIAAIMARHRPLGDRKKGRIIDVTEAAQTKDVMPVAELMK